MLFKASRPSRHVFLMSAAVSLLVGGLGRTAAAKDCTTDADCDTGYQCVPGQAVAGTGSSGGGVVGSGSGTAGSATCPQGTNCTTTTPAAGTPSVPAGDASAPTTSDPMDADPAPSGKKDAGVVAFPVDARTASSAQLDAKPLPPMPVPEPVPTLTTGICEPKPIVCTSVADCPSADFDCVMDSIPSTQPTCPPNMKCETPPPQTSTTGTCYAKPHACSTAADCPAPLTCQAEGATCSGSAMVGPDGTVTTTPDTCTPGPSVCTWLPVTCTADTGCADPLYQCVKVSESGWCTGSSGACAAGETCPAPEPPTCGTTVIMNCLPKLVDCGSGQTCPVGWSCFDFSNFGGVPATWGSIASNKACLPDGIILAAQGHAAGGSQVTASSGPTRGGAPGSVDLGVPTGTDGKSDTSTDTATGVGTGPSGGGTTPSPANAAPPTQGGPTASADGGSSLQPMAHSSGCAYGGSDAGQISLWLALAMTGLVARRARRRPGDR